MSEAARDQAGEGQPGAGGAMSARATARALAERLWELDFKRDDSKEAAAQAVGRADEALGPAEVFCVWLQAQEELAGLAARALASPPLGRGKGWVLNKWSSAIGALSSSGSGAGARMLIGAARDLASESLAGASGPERLAAGLDLICSQEPGFAPDLSMIRKKMLVKLALPGEPAWVEGVTRALVAIGSGVEPSGNRPGESQEIETLAKPLCRVAAKMLGGQPAEIERLARVLEGMGPVSRALGLEVAAMLPIKALGRKKTLGEWPLAVLLAAGSPPSKAGPVSLESAALMSEEEAEALLDLGARRASLFLANPKAALEELEARAGSNLADIGAWMSHVAEAFKAAGADPGEGAQMAIALMATPASEQVKGSFAIRAGAFAEGELIKASLEPAPVEAPARSRRL